MKNFCLPIIILLCFLFVVPGYGQGLDHALGDILVKVKKERLETLVADLQEFEGKPTQLEIKRLVSEPMDIWLLGFDFTAVHEIRFLDHLRNHPLVEMAQFNHLVQMRNTPDDPEFGTQWHLQNTGAGGGTPDADLDAEEAWDITTGGLTAAGDTIVIAILDDGVDLEHPDLKENLWVNSNEIPNNDIDDDGNGYIDDYLGWNIFTDDDDIGGLFAGSHGTGVSGMVGAVGNNETGVSGINWNVKIMMIENDFDTDEAMVLEAYTYPLVMRQLYNITDGEKGAFVVVTNASWGINFGQPSDAPLWCAFYDTLGTHGILSCGATANLNIDIDVDGDLPTACPSDYLISVTASNSNDIRTFSAYGKTTIDLAAPGDGVYTTSLGGGYGFTSGTSFASPLTAGVVGLLYSIPCSNLADLAKADPAGAALYVKQILLAGVDAIPNLENEVLAGGRVNAFNSLSFLLANCDDACPIPFPFQPTAITDEEVTLAWFASDSAQSITLRWREAGSTNWNEVEDAASPYILSDLFGCTDYEFQLEAICADTASGFSNVMVFTTEGCCELPDGFEVINITENSVFAQWEDYVWADKYLVRYKKTTDTEWLTKTSPFPFVPLNDLDSCTLYEVQLQALCPIDTTDFTASILFKTKGCGACTDFDYCPSLAFNAGLEWIEQVIVKDMDNVSGSNGGYAFFETMSTILTQDSSYEITIVPGFDGFTYTENFQAWIDFDQNGVFDLPQELVFDGGASDMAVSGIIYVPEDAVLGYTRMRVSMSFSSPAGPCSQFTYGEVEDYCVEIKSRFIRCVEPPNLDTVQITHNSVLFNWGKPTETTIAYNFRYRGEGDTIWNEYTSLDEQHFIGDLDSCKLYEAQVRAICGADISDFSKSLVFQTRCQVITNTYEETQRRLFVQAFPNPFREHLRINVQMNERDDLNLDMYNMVGSRVYSSSWTGLSTGDHFFTLDDLPDLPPGAYFLSLTTGKGDRAMIKVLSQ